MSVASQQSKQVFLGSSKSASEHLDRIAVWLEEADLAPVPWDEPGVILPGSPVMRQLLDKARHDVLAAVLIFAEDDLLADGAQSVPRDNVLLEYGLFAGVLGEENTIVIVVGKPKLPRDLSAIYVDLNKPNRAKADIKAWARNLEPRKSGFSGKLFETYVDGALCTEDTGVARTEIIKHATDQTLIPGRFLYDNEVGTDYWIDLCTDKMYTYFQDGLRFWGDEADTFVTAIKEGVGHEFDFISLGPGNGQKDVELIRAWINDKDLDVIYYPYDVSLRMLAQAVREIRKLHANVRLRAVLADFENLAQMHTVFASRDAPNVISLLGNSLGNLSDELHFLKNLRALMNSGDLLLLEVRLKDGNKRESGPSELSRPKAKQFYFSPLEHYLAIKCDPKKLKSRKEGPAKNGLSKINGTQSTLIYYEDFAFGDEKYSDTKLLCINEYDHDSFVRAMERANFESIIPPRVDEDGRFLVCLMRKP